MFFNFIILLLDPDSDPAGSEKVGSVTSLIIILVILFSSPLYLEEFKIDYIL